MLLALAGILMEANWGGDGKIHPTSRHLSTQPGCV